MSRSDVAKGYARALFDLAQMTDTVDAADESLSALAASLRGSIDLRAALTDTSVPVEKRRDVLRDIFGASVTPEVLAIATLMADRGESARVSDVAREYREIAEKERGVLVAEVTTAIALTDALRESVSAKLAASLGSPVVLREHVDERIVGGIRINVAGRVLDGSVSSQLDGARRALVGTQGGEA